MNAPGVATDGTRVARERLVELFTKMKERRIVVVGDAMLDVYLEGDADRLSPEAPVPVVIVRGRRSALGGAANVAANVAATGAASAGVVPVAAVSAPSVSASSASFSSV